MDSRSSRLSNSRPPPPAAPAITPVGEAAQGAEILGELPGPAGVVL